MTHYPLASLFSVFMLISACQQEQTDGHNHHSPNPSSFNDSYGEQLGSISFPTSCNREAQKHIERGVALLHHMTYQGSEESFTKALNADDECAMARWGLAMSWVHPLWPDVTNNKQFEQGLKLLQEAMAIGQKTQRESDYISAVAAYYNSRSAPESQRLAEFERGWRKVYEQYPDDLEAKSFYALALTGTAELNTKGLTIRSNAGHIIETILDKAPEHPGAHHYAIHAYDSPTLAPQALEVAHHYGDVAPNVAHALHMPSHIFTRLGKWPESIDMNIRSGNASLAAHPEEISFEYLHSLDYKVYAELQTCQDKSAASSVTIAMSPQKPYLPLNLSASAYALSAMPARLALERRDWRSAAQLEVGAPKAFSWDESHAAFIAINQFAKGLGAARSDSWEIAQESLRQLKELRQHIVGTSANSYWAAQIDVQIKTLSAWIALSEKDLPTALILMKEAAIIEAHTDKHAVSPGEVLPAQELLGDMLLMAGQTEDALTAYKAELIRSPNRFNSLYGAAVAAEKLQDNKQAREYFQLLANNCHGSTANRPRLQHARNFLAEVANDEAQP